MSSPGCGYSGAYLNLLVFQRLDSLSWWFVNESFSNAENQSKVKMCRVNLAVISVCVKYFTLAQTERTCMELAVLQKKYIACLFIFKKYTPGNKDVPTHLYHL